MRERRHVVLEEIVDIMAVRYCKNYTHPAHDETDTDFQRLLLKVWGLHQGGCPRGETEYCANKVAKYYRADFGEVYDFIYGRMT